MITESGTKIKVVEALCGCGKSYWALEHMRKNKHKSWIFVTPFLSEAGDDKQKGRVRETLPEMDFHTPSDKGDMTKTEHLEHLLLKGCNVAITHSLFLKITEQSLLSIKDNNYCIVIDEVIDKVQIFNTTRNRVDDIKALLDKGIIHLDERDRIIWPEELFLNTFAEEFELCQRGFLYLFNEHLLIKNYAADVYENAEEVIVLTYLFKYSPMRTWFKANNIEWEYISPDLRVSTKERKSRIRPLITLEKEDKDLIKLYTPRESEYCSSWFNRVADKRSKESTEEFRLMRKVATRLYERWKKQEGTPNIMFCCFKEYANYVAGKGTREHDVNDEGTKHVSKNARASNAWSDRTHLIYWPNTYPHVDVKNYLDKFVGEEYRLDSDGYAVSELVQWVFRSAIREGQPIKLFIASRRMRRLFTEWLEQED